MSCTTEVALHIMDDGQDYGYAFWEINGRQAASRSWITEAYLCWARSE